MKEYIIDAKNKRLGRLASDIAVALQGKKSPDYEPRKVGDRVVVKNYRSFSVTGNKRTQKVYYRHTGYMGHLKEAKLFELLEKDPKRVLKEAVRKMLPKNALNQKRMRNLIFSEE